MSAQEQEEEKKQEPPNEESFEDVFFQAVLGAQLIQTAYLGHKLGWYTALEKAGNDGLTSDELASTTHSSQRYAREWLEQQTVAGWILCDNPSASLPDRIFHLPPSHAQVLANQDSLSYGMPLAILHGATGKVLNELVQAYKEDTGVSWNDTGEDAREAQAAMNRPFFRLQFGATLEEHLDQDVVSRLCKGGKVADVGCGYAYSSIGVAKHFKNCTVDAFDMDEPSIVQARENIQKEGLESRVHAYCKNAASALTTTDDSLFEPYDLVMALECIHDMSNPISVLKTMKDLAGANGTVLVMDERVADSFAKGIGNPMEQAMYGFSCTCCLADCKSHANSAETGTVMRPSILKMYAQQAGFRQVQILPVEHDFFYFYILQQ